VGWTLVFEMYFCQLFCGQHAVPPPALVCAGIVGAAERGALPLSQRG
jgi:hypothetical protein